MDPDDRLLRPLWEVLAPLLADEGGVPVGRRSVVIGVACSGGRDSMALLDAVVRCCREGIAGWSVPVGGAGHGVVQVVALHVHHGLSAYADHWSEHVRYWCEVTDAAATTEGWTVQVAFRERRVTWVRRPGDSLEAQARFARYEALGDMAREAGAATVLLAQHQDDQAETFLLQVLRSGGVYGWSGMAERKVAGGVEFVRPWLGVRRGDIDAVVSARGVPFVEDDSNIDTRHARNRLRLDVMPRLESAFAQAVPVLAGSAQLAQDAAACLSDLAEADLAATAAVGGLRLGGLLALSEPRRRNALRHWLVHTLGAKPTRSLLQRLSTELKTDGTTGCWALPPAGELRVHQGCLRWRPASDAAKSLGWPSGWIVSIGVAGPGCYPVPGEDGRRLGELVLSLDASGPRAVVAPGTTLTLQARLGGEQFQRHLRSVPRSLKKQYQSAGVPAWERRGPLVWCGPELYWVPGLGLDARVWVDSDASGDACAIEWRPAQVE